MSSDRTCRMSDLRAAKSQLQREISAVESVARRAESTISSIRSNMSDTRKKVEGLTREVQNLSGDVSQQRKKLYEIDSSVADLQSQQHADRRRIKRNKKLIESIEQHITLLDQDVEANREVIKQARRHIQILEQEAQLAQQRIAENDQHIQQLQDGVQSIHNYLEQERQTRERERIAQMDDVRAQSQMAAALLDSLDFERVRRFGYESHYLTARKTLLHAAESAQQGRLEAARATYQEAQRQLEQVARDVDAREREYFYHRSVCESALKQLGQDLERIGTEDMHQWHAADYAALQAQYEDLKRRFQYAEFDQAGRPEQVIAALEAMTDTANQLQQRVVALDQQLMETLKQASARIDMMERVLNALMDIWGDNDFEISYGYADKTDPKTTLKVQTIRPNRSNVTLYMDLDGTFRFSWTGYVGMECATDADQFEEILRDQYQLEMATFSVENKPGQPNPDFGPGGPGVTIIQMPKQRRAETARSTGG